MPQLGCHAALRISHPSGHMHCGPVRVMNTYMYTAVCVFTIVILLVLVYYWYIIAVTQHNLGCAACAWSFPNSNVYQNQFGQHRVLKRMGVCLVQVPSAHVERLDLIPDVDKGQLSVLVHGSPAAKGLKVIFPLSVCNAALCELCYVSNVAQCERE